uniref:Uncharacterized protein n=1 Tax=Bionectria ochroleuca TaxID=29856 RepID=A0A8H7K8W0_BIOOC
MAPLDFPPEATCFDSFAYFASIVSWMVAHCINSPPQQVEPDLFQEPLDFNAFPLFVRPIDVYLIKHFSSAIWAGSRFP